MAKIPRRNPSSMSDEPERRNWLELPRDVTASIVSRLGAVDILQNAQKVCSLWRDICKDSSMWRSIDMRNNNFSDSELEQMCMHAVDRSKGELVDITMEYFCRDELLSYITQRTNGLRRLRIISSCYRLVDEGLIVAAPKLPFLEELELTGCNNISGEGLAVVGRCCPNLKTFKLNAMGFKGRRWKTNKEARAIAGNMHGLRYLQLYGNRLTNKGLLAILDGCPHLESLDLRLCNYVILQGDLEERCAQQIEHLRRPDDSTEDYEYGASSLDISYISDGNGHATSDSGYDNDYDRDCEGWYTDSGDDESAALNEVFYRRRG